MLGMSLAKGPWGRGANTPGQVVLCRLAQSFSKSLLRGEVKKDVGCTLTADGSVYNFPGEYHEHTRVHTRVSCTRNTNTRLPKTKNSLPCIYI